jgi:hypothetical protein
MTGKPISNRDRFDFDRFMDSIMDLGFHEMFNALNNECLRIEASMSGRGGPQARADGAGDYVSRLKRVGFWFHNGYPPPYDGREDAVCYRIAVKLAEKGELRPESLNAHIWERLLGSR